MQKFYDHFAIANKSLQERLGTAPNALNKLSALYGAQARSFVQMLNYGLDAITGRAASHLLNMDVLHSNDAYLLKLGEGILLNSIISITPPLIRKGNEFRFFSRRDYAKYSALGTVTLENGASANLIAYDIVNEENPSAGAREELAQSYTALYCAGQYIQQKFESGDVDLTPGTFQSVYVAEDYKTIWSESVHITINGLGDKGMEVTPIWSIPELLSYTDTSQLVFCQNTPRGLTVILGDGEIFGSAYNNADTFSKIEGVTIEYIKAASTSPANNATISFNGDITPSGNIHGIPVLGKPLMGDTANTFRSRAIAEAYASGKITNEKDLETEIAKIPFIKSVHAWRKIDDFMPSEWAGSNAPYPEKAMCTHKDAIYIVLGKAEESASPDDPDSAWQLVVTKSTYKNLHQMGLNVETAFRYDNATIEMSGLIATNRYYWSPTITYRRGDVVYYADTKTLYVCLIDGSGHVPGEEPGADGIVYWRDVNSLMPDDPTIEEYEPITQGIYELELKAYFGIWTRLGFTSVVVRPCHPIDATIVCTYASPYERTDEIVEFIRDAVCYRVGRIPTPSELHSSLTEKFGLTKVYVTYEGVVSEIGDNAYISRSGLTLKVLEEE